MTCYSPITAYYGKRVGDTGKRGIVFSKTAAHTGVPLRLPCGKCIGCRLEHSRQWAVRCMHEKQLYNSSEFMTLTYDDKHLPPGNTLVKRELQLFMKRLRKETGNGLRFYACGEYGEHTRRPHYHVLLFNYSFADRRYYKLARSGERLYTSKMVDSLWPCGFNVLGNVTFNSCAYVARYIVKKIYGDKADEYYAGREREFTVMSRRPGIGAPWFDRYGEHAYNFDSVVINGREVRPPRYYDGRYELLDPARMSALKFKRRTAAIQSLSDRTPERRRVREIVAKAQFSLRKPEDR